MFIEPQGRKKFIEQQNIALRMGRAKVVVAAQLVNKLDTWGYVINGVAILLGGGQVLGGAGIVMAALSHGNIIAIGAGALLALHGLNSIEEGIKNIKSGKSDQTGFFKQRYIATAEFIGFDKKIGAIAYSSVDVALSAYGLSRMVLKPDAWRLFRHLPSDFVRNIKNTSAPALFIEGVGDGLSIKSAYDGYNK